MNVKGTKNPLLDLTGFQVHRARLAKRFSGKKVLVLGGTGFLGGWLANALDCVGARVTIAARNKPSDPFPRNIAFKHFDVRGAGHLPETEYAFFTVLPTRPQWMLERRRLVTQTISGLLRSFADLQGRGTRTILASTGSVYGSHPGPIGEKTLPEGSSVNAAYHLTLESLFRGFAADGRDPLVIRFFSLYGPHQPETQAVAHVLESVIGRKKIHLRTPPDETRDFVYIADAAICALLLASSDSAYGQTVNVCTGKATTLESLVRQVQNIAGTSLTTTYSDSADEKGIRLVGSDRLLQSLFTYHFLSVREGIESTWDWMKRQREPGTENKRA